MKQNAQVLIKMCQITSKYAKPAIWTNAIGFQAVKCGMANM